MHRHIQKKSFVVLVTAWLLLASANAFAADTSANWKTECVGRYQVSLPGEGEFALTTEKGFLTSDLGAHIGFKNGSPAPHSNFIYGGKINISSTITPQEFALFQKKINVRSTELKKYYLDSYREDIAENIKPAILTLATSFSWQIGVVAHQYIYQAERIFNFIVGERDSLVENLELINKLVRALRPRPIFTVPQEPGVCIPYGFIADDGKQGRHVAVTMRLKDHPDVEIFFEDKTAYDYGIKQTAQNQERTEMSMLWNQQAQSSKEIKLAFPGYRSIKLAGRDGTDSFVEITRKDGSSDYGYAAVVNGDHTAKTDAPQLVLYVVRTASRAKGKPVSKNELKDIAHKIAASVKRREVK